MLERCNKRSILLSAGTKKGIITKGRSTVQAPNTAAQVSFHHWLNRSGAFLSKEIFLCLISSMLCIREGIQIPHHLLISRGTSYQTLIIGQAPGSENNAKFYNIDVLDFIILMFWECFSSIACQSHMPDCHTNYPSLAIFTCVLKLQIPFTCQHKKLH